MAAAVAKLMSNKDLVLVAAKIRNVTRCRNTLGERGVLGMRLQPNHPADDLGGILLSAVEGLLYGCGDAVIGVNPAIESVDTVAAILHALDRLIRGHRRADAALLPGPHHHAACRAGARRAGRSAVSIGRRHRRRRTPASASAWPLLGEGRERVLEHHAQRDVAWVGQDVMYFETGQGSALSAEAHHGVDQLTLEARAYGVARAFDPFLVNTVVGFIGPEYLYDERQITRAGLEDHFMGKLLGLPMGCDVCYTNHAAGRSELGRQPADAAHRGRLQLLHGRALRRRRDAQLPIDQLPRRRGDAAAVRPDAGAGVSRLAGRARHLCRRATGARRRRRGIRCSAELQSVLERPRRVSNDGDRPHAANASSLRSRRRIATSALSPRRWQPCGLARRRGWSWAAPGRPIAPARNSSCARTMPRPSTPCRPKWI